MFTNQIHFTIMEGNYFSLQKYFPLHWWKPWYNKALSEWLSISSQAFSFDRKVIKKYQCTMVLHFLLCGLAPFRNSKKTLNNEVCICWMKHVCAPPFCWPEFLHTLKYRLKASADILIMYIYTGSNLGKHAVKHYYKCLQYCFEVNVKFGP